MKISVPKERRAHERRVAASPDTVKRLVGMGLEPVVESGAGDGASFTDDAYKAAGAQIASSAAEALGAGDIVLKVQRPLPDELRAMKRGAVLVGMLAPLQHGEDIASYAGAGISAFAMELVPRITRAQSMDVLSSQANLAGYRIVLEAATRVRTRAADDDDRGRHDPAGARPRHGHRCRGASGDRDGAAPRRHRLGDRCAACREGAGREPRRIVPRRRSRGDDGDGDGRRLRQGDGRGFRPPPARACRRGAEEDRHRLCTALVPGRRAPILITRDMVAQMRPGSVIADLAVEQGGNVEGSVAGENVVTAGGVTILGPINVPSHIAVDASQLYARNLVAFLGAHRRQGKESRRSIRPTRS